jgi:hypothetical protein
MTIVGAAALVISIVALILRLRETQKDLGSMMEQNIRLLKSEVENINLLREAETLVKQLNEENNRLNRIDKEARKLILILRGEVNSLNAQLTEAENNAE